VNIKMYILNISQPRINIDNTPYALWFRRPSLVKHFIVYGIQYYIKRGDGNLGKFDSRLDEGIFLSNSSKKKAYKCYKSRLCKIMEYENVKVNALKSRSIKYKDNSQFDERRRNGDDEE
jgi:hypothetical protein